MPTMRRSLSPGRDSFYVLLVFVIAASVRIAWITSPDVPPPTWDAARYQHETARVADALRDPLALIEGSGGERRTFVHSLRVFVSRGPVYPGVLTIHQLVFGDDVRSIRWLHVILDLATLFLLWRISIRVLGPRWALLPPAVYALWPAVILSTGLVLQETLFTLLLVAATLAWLRWDERPGMRRGLVVAALLVIVSATRTSHQFILFFAPVLLAAHAWSSGRPLRLALPATFLVLASLAAWLTTTWIVVGEPTGLGGRLGNSVLYEVSAPERDGWPVDALRMQTDAHAWFVEDRPSLRDASEGATIGTRRTLVEIPGNDQGVLSVAARTEILSDPVTWIASVASRAHRLWRHAYNDYQISILLPYAQQSALHRIVAYLGILGTLIALLDWRRNALWLLLMAYSTGIYAIYQIESRYNAPLLPFLFLGATLCTKVVWVTLLAWHRSGGRIREWTVHGLVGLAFAVVCGALWFATAGAGGSDPLRTFLAVSTWVLLIVISGLVIRATWMEGRRRLGIPIASLVGAMILLVVSTSGKESHLVETPRVAIPASPGGLRATIEISPEAGTLPSRIALNLAVPLGTMEVLVVEVDGEVVELPLESHGPRAQYEHFVYPTYFKLVPEGTLFPVWVDIPLSAAAVADGMLELSVSTMGLTGTAADDPVLLGSPSGRTPLPAASLWNLSFYRMVTAGDPRLLSDEMARPIPLELNQPGRSTQHVLLTSWCRLSAGASVSAEVPVVPAE